MECEAGSTIRWSWSGLPLRQSRSLIAGIAHAWIWLLVSLGLGSAFLVRLGAGSNRGFRSWVRLAVINAGGAALYCILAWCIFSRWPTPTPLLTPYEDQPEEKTEFLHWFDQGAHHGQFGMGQIICVLGWSEAESHGYVSGYEAAIGTWIRATDLPFYGKVPDQMTALFRGDIVPIGNWLADPDVEVDERDPDGRTTLHVACETGLDIPETIHWLLNRGADVNAVDSMGYTPLHHSARRGRMSVLRVLVEAGASINAPTEGGHTPLHQAAGGGHADAVRYLIEHGAQVDARSNEYGTTPLMSAALEGRVETARALIDAGADVDARNKRGESVLEAASSPTWVDVNPVLCLLLDRGADTAFVETLDDRSKRELLRLIERCRHSESVREPAATRE